LPNQPLAKWIYSTYFYAPKQQKKVLNSGSMVIGKLSILKLWSIFSLNKVGFALCCLIFATL
jgi:hypothetical protein